MKFFTILRRSVIAVAALAMITASESWAGIVNTLPTIRINGNILYYYDTQSGDNIYTIADKLGVSVDDIRKSNPSVADGIKPRMRLYFPTDIETRSETTTDGPLTHIVAKGESIYGIARQYSITVDELMAMNPAAEDGIKPGMRLNIRNNSTTATTTSASTASAISVAATTVTPDVEVEEPQPADVVISAKADATLLAELPETPAEAKEMNVAIILPFLLNEETMGRQTKIYTEFYKGFLLAADTLNLPGRTPIHIHAYDSAASLDSVRAIMRRPEMADMSLIVAPDNAAQVEMVAKMAPEGCIIFNTFAIKDTGYTTNPNIIQSNIPHDEMYSRAIDGFIDCFPTATPVFLTRTSGKNDKEEFTTALKARLDKEFRIYQTIEFDGYLSDSDLEMLDPDIFTYVFIPASGNRDEFSRILNAIKTLRGKAENPEAVQVFGYPEWATFRGTQFDEICDIEATIYSRYSPTSKNADFQTLNSAYRRTYGEKIADNQMPVPGVLGFDTGMMVIEGLRTLAGTGNFPTTFSGIQSGLRLDRVDNGGLFNNSLFIINYKPGGSIEKTLK
jgi:LysM repeat protein